MTHTTEQLETMLAAATPGPWWTDAKYSGVEMGCAIIAARTDSGPLPGNPTRGMVAWSSAILNTESRRCEANARLIALAPTITAELIALRAEVATLRASEARMREALTIAETTIADLERANASYQAALSERGIDGSKGTEE